MPTHLQLVENKYILQKTLITLFLHNHVTNKQHKKTYNIKIIVHKNAIH